MPRSQFTQLTKAQHTLLMRFSPVGRTGFFAGRSVLAAVALTEKGFLERNEDDSFRLTILGRAYVWRALVVNAVAQF